MSRYIDADKLKKDVLDLQGCYNGFSDTYDKACIIGVIDEQPTIEAQQWIPCGERLPENNDIVLITMDDSITVRGEFIEQLSNELGFFKDGAWHWAYESGQDYWPETTHVTAWMTLPGPYKGDE